jgi:hypothetical protein
MHDKRTGNETDAILERLRWWGRVVDDLASCPIEDIRINAGRISFFIDARRCEKQLLPGFATPAQSVHEMTPAEQHSLSRYLVRHHKDQFACAARAMTRKRQVGWPKILVVSDEIEFTLSGGFISEALEVYNE